MLIPIIIMIINSMIIMLKNKLLYSFIELLISSSCVL